MFRTSQEMFSPFLIVMIVKTVYETWALVENLVGSALIKSSPNGGGFRRGRSVSVAMAGRARGAISAVLALFVTFWGDAKK